MFVQKTNNSCKCLAGAANAFDLYNMASGFRAILQNGRNHSMPAEETSPLPSYHSDTLRTQTRANIIRPLSVRASDSSTDCTRPRSIHARKGFNVTLPTPQPTRRISKLSDPSHTQFSLDQPPTITHHARHALALEQWLLTSELTPLFVRTRHTLKRTFTVAATSLQTSRGAGCRNARRRRSVFLRAQHSTSPRKARQAPIYNPCHKSPGAEAARGAMSRDGPSAQRQLGPQASSIEGNTAFVRNSAPTARRQVG